RKSGPARDADWGNYIAGTRPGSRSARARKLRRGRRIDDLGPWTDGRNQGSAAARLAWKPRRIDRNCSAPCSGCSCRLPRSPRLVPDCRWQWMYTLQALWTMAREGLNITTVVFANRDYAVLKREFFYLGVGSPGPRAAAMFEIGHPDLDWVALAKG